MPRLILFRHAKSDWETDYGSDHERPLAPRGVAAATAMGVAMARSGEIPDHVITSSAVRARSTLELAASAGEWTMPVVITDELYGTSPEAALRVAAGAPQGTERLMLVGHEPTWSTLVHHLTGARVAVKTATVVGIDLAVTSWRAAPGASGDIVYVLPARLFTDGDWDMP